LGLCFAKDVLRLGEGHDTSRFLNARTSQGNRERCGKSERRQGDRDAKSMPSSGPVRHRMTRVGRLTRLAVCSPRRDRPVERRARRGDALGMSSGSTLAGRI
jgi:hypothetical protein